MTSISTAASLGPCRFVLAEYLPVEVLAVACGQRFAFEQPEGAPTVGSPLGAQEQRLARVLGEAALSQVVQVSDEDHPDAGLGQRADDLPGDLGAFPLVGGGEGLVAQ